MRSPIRHSPRAAIREWLSHTDGNHLTGTEKGTKVWSKRREGRSRTPQPEAFEAPQRYVDKHHCQPQKERWCSRFYDTSVKRLAWLMSGPGDHTIHPKDGPNIAEQLGLHAPFRSIANHSGDIHTKPRAEGHRPKRRRRSSSSASYLEPAVYPNNSDEGKQDRKSLKTEETQRQRQHTHIELSSRSSSTTVDLPEKAAKTYEKRPRHKTREDRYELKKDKKYDEIDKGRAKARDKRKKKKQGVEKSGAALMQRFSAKNVEPERLTVSLKNLTSDVYHHVKVAEVRTAQGYSSSWFFWKRARLFTLPDLTFSEVNFLGHRRRNQEENNRSKAKSKRRKEDRAADTEAEFSRFFSSSKDLNRAAADPIEYEAKERTATETAQKHSRSSIPPVDLPGKPFLGFGNCGPGHVSASIMDPRATVQNDHSRPSPTHRLSSTRSTTYFTWSRSSPSRYNVSELRYKSPQTIFGNCTESRPSHGMENKGREGSLPEKADRDSYEVSRTPSNRYGERSMPRTEHGSNCRNVFVPDSIHGPAEKSVAAADRTTVGNRGISENQRRSDQSTLQDKHPLRDASHTNNDLASLLASQNRPELLGAVLDLLLGKTSAHNKSRQNSKDSRSADSKSMDHTAVREVTPKIQLPFETMDGHDPELPHNDSQSIQDPERIVSPQQIPYVQRPQPSATSKPTNVTRTTTSPSQDALKKMKLIERPHLPQYDDLLDPPSQVSARRPESSNAWTGYRNLYQGQIKTQTNTVNHNLNIDGIHSEKFNRVAQAYGPTAHTVDEAPHSGFLNHGVPFHMFPEDQSHDPCFDPEFSLGHSTDLQDFASANTHEAINETFHQQHEEMFDKGEATNQDVPIKIGGRPFEHADDTLSGEDHGLYQQFERPTFIGGKGFMDLAQDADFSSWSTRKISATQDSRFEIPKTGDKANTEAADDAPLTSFWKPHKLY
ncbi:MAG: hypothetical protein Q9209_000756 [Squamulea sp. 1 TL-2023]